MTDPEPVAPVAATAPAGWYPVAAGSAQQRYWDGTAWTEHIHNPAVQNAPVAVVRRELLRAPERTNPTTLWFWLTAVSSVLGIGAWIALGIYGNQLVGISGNYTTEIGAMYTSPAYITYTVLSFAVVAAGVVFPILDWLALRKRGVPNPFHWAWSLFAIALSSPIVYVIGRTVVVKRRTGKGLAPLWVFIALQLITWIVALVAIIVFVSSLVAQFAGQFPDAGNVL